MDKKKEDGVLDPRIDLIGEIVILSYRVKPDRWTKMTANDDNLKIIERFLDDPNEKQIILTLTGGQFYVFKAYQPSMKQKYTHFSRKQKEKVTVVNFRRVIRFGEMSGTPVEDLSVLMNGVFSPILSNPGNQNGWPHTVKLDMAAHLKDFNNHMEEIRGAIASQTVLPMPSGVMHIHASLSSFVGSNGEASDLAFKTEIENAVVRWSHICHEVTNQNSKLAFTDGAHPTPMEEVNFWKNRQKNLQYIYDQLIDPRVKKMSEYLEVTKSIYLKMFKSTFQNVVASLLEARDITLYLKPLIPHIKRFEDNDFLELKDYIKPLIHVVGLIWAHSRYYANCEKIVTLFREIANLLIECAVKDLDPSSVFLGEAEEICMKVTKTIDMLNIFLTSFEYVRQNLTDFYEKTEDVTPLPWTFHRRTAFQRLIELLDRLHLVKKILEANINYSKLERVEIGGFRGKYLTMKCEEIFTDFGRIYSVFQNITYNVLDIEDHQIHDDYKLFEDKCADIDYRLASVFEQAFDDCSNLDASFKLINIIGNLMERPSVRSEVTKKLPELIDKMNEEVDSVKIMYDDCEKNGVHLHNYCPPIFGRIYWYKQLRERIDGHEEHARLIEHEIFKSEEAVYMLAKYAQMRKILDNATEKLLKDWAERIREEIKESLEKTQLAKDSKGDIFVNLDPRLEAILREMRYLKQLNIRDVPEEAMAVYEQVEAFYETYLRLKRIQQYYNFLKNETLEVECDMINTAMQALDNMLEPMLTHITWSENDPEHVHVMYEIVKYLYDRVAEAQQNIANLMKNIETWSTVPLFERKDGKKENLLNTDDKAERIQKRYDQINNCAQELKIVLYHNYHLYFDLPYTPTPTPPSERTRTVDKVQKHDKKSATTRTSQTSSSSDEQDDDVDMLEEKSRVMTVESTSRAETSGEKFNKRREYIKSSSQKLKKFRVPTSEDEKSVAQFTQPPEPIMTKKWNAYLTHLDRELLKKLTEAVLISQKYFTKEMGGTKPVTPFLEILMFLKEPDIVYEPSIDTNDKPNILSNMEDLLQDIYNMGFYMERIDPDCEEGNYFNNLIDMLEGIQNYEAISYKILGAMGEASDFIDNFEEYIFLWATDRQEYLREFLKYSRPLTFEERQWLGHESAPVIKEDPPTLALFKEKIDFYDHMYEEVKTLPQEHLIDGGWFRIVVKPLRQAIMNTICKWGNLFKQHLYNHVLESLNKLENFITESTGLMLAQLDSDDFEGLLKVMKILFQVKEMMVETDAMFEPLKNIMDLLHSYHVEFPEEIYVQLQEIPDRWTYCKKVAATTKQNVSSLQTVQINTIKKRIRLFDARISLYRQQFRRDDIFNFDCKKVYKKIDRKHTEILVFEREEKELMADGNIFDIVIEDFKAIKQCRKELKQIKQLWDYINMMNSCINEWRATPWKKIDIENMEISCKRFVKDLRVMDKETKSWNVYIEGEKTIKNLLTSLRAVTELQNPAIRERHWKQLMKATKVPFVMSEQTTLNNLLELNLHEFEDEVKTIVDKSVKEMGMEKILKELEATWTTMSFTTETHPSTGVNLLHISEELIESLEDNQSALQSMMNSKFIDYFLDEVTKWQNLLSVADQVIQLFVEVQHKWMYLESIFIGSDDIRIQLPEDSKRFELIDKEFREILTNLSRNLNVIAVTNQPGLYDKLEKLLERLTLCEKALNDYLETKRLAFPRFYFVSSADLLDILSNGNQPELIQRHLTKLFDSLARLVFEPNSKIAHTMKSKENDEYVKLVTPLECSGKVEIWLNKLIEAMRKTLRSCLNEAIMNYEEKSRELWIFDYPAQPALCGTQIWWTTEVNHALSRLEEGYDSALKDYQRKQIAQLNALIALLLGDLSAGDRQKIMTICTIDVHSRDVVHKMIVSKVENAQAFQWQSQIRHRWDLKLNDCFGNICDAQFRYQYEYLGNTPRLVITPLTDRCYITLTQSLHLIMGGAPAGPAGTGKTETTKDLGKSLGVMVYVFNCSEQMDYKSIGNIYKGLVQTGCWGCFDEFNRISIEVLSVVAVQVKTIQDAIKDNRKKFKFLGAKIQLIHTIGIFITMNPGYAGRTELPENLKALFRPCAMVVPDFELICEIMLVAEGFQEARLLARKFITLYTLCRELLSKQDHYDWGLRAIKSVLVVAGALKRDDRARPEDQVLMRALRDFNIPKIITDDVPIFMGLIGDLFPALDVPRKRDMKFENTIREASIESQLQPEEGFILKIVQLEELLAVRHSVFIIGSTGTGKSMVWKTLFRTYQQLKRKPFYNDLNPKAVTNDELFGVINPSSREWRDGLFSVIMRDQTNLTGEGPKWIVLDGDIDPMWIESLNTLMDDNKVLTLASNERIALTKHMRLLFEIANLRTATPATVSRAGILYINPSDLGWNPYVASWIEKRTSQSEKTNLSILFDKYVPPCLDIMKIKFKKITPISDIAHIQMLCFLLDCFLTSQNISPESPKEWYEIYFVFAVIWAFGSCLFQDQLVDWRNEFSRWFLNEFKTVKFPASGNVFSFYIDTETKKFFPWTEIVPKFEFDSDIPLQATLVETNETTRIRFFVKNLIDKKVPVMLVGPAGSGKSVILNALIEDLPDSHLVTRIPFNFYTTSEMLQSILEKPLEKKAGRVFAPIGGKNMIYFIDDMNMPEVDKYFTVQPHTLIKQYMDYQHWYDRQKLILKEIQNVQFISSMNPNAGSFTIDTRLQRHFCVFAVSFPAAECSTHIYNNILNEHFKNPFLKFTPAVSKHYSEIVTAALALHAKVSQTFLPTAIKFHYIFTLRDVSNVFQGLLFSTGDSIKTYVDLIRLWMHETNRVYEDKLVNKNDINQMKKLLKDTAKQYTEDVEESEIFSEPLIYCHFALGIGDPKYFPIYEFSHLNNLLEEVLNGYNDLIAAMNLVLFEDAMYHICRINRILESPRGNALLVGVGGSGKQSLTRLAAFISSFSVFQIQLSKTYSLSDMKADLATLYLKSGLRSVGIVFLMTDAQIPNEEFLVLINDILASGEISDLLSDEEVENVIFSVKGEVKNLGLVDTRENCWKFFINRVRRLLKCVLCFSPVGTTLRVRSRKFPAIINCVSIDWFHEWPEEALFSVSARFLSEIPDLPADLIESVSRFMSYAHNKVNEISAIYLDNEKRYNYTTPKSFLEQISLYSNLLGERNSTLSTNIDRLRIGLEKLDSTSEEVEGLKDILAVQEIEVKEKNEAASKMIAVLSAENEKVAAEQELATEEEAKVRTIEEDVSVKQRICAIDLEKAEPALVAAMQALDTLNKNNLTELKSFATPPEAVAKVCAAVLVLFSKKGKIPKDRSWKQCRALMGKADQFLHDLKEYDKDNIENDVVKAVYEYMKDPEFHPQKIFSKSLAAAGLCSWVINIIKYHEIFIVVEPKRQALQRANRELQEARTKLDNLNRKLDLLEETLSALRAEFDLAITAKMKCQAEADATFSMIDLANRLVTGLGSEKIRWKELMTDYAAQMVTLPGDVLLISSFISYVGCFSRNYREALLNKYWVPFLSNLTVKIPRSENLDPLSLLTDDAMIAEWNNDGLPTDRMSSENACILLNSARWPLMIDPQLQGISWIKTKYGDLLHIIRLSMPNYLDILENCISQGATVLLENIGEQIDSVLEPILGRVLIKKGTAIKIGDKDIDYNPSFRLIIQTKLANPHYKPEIQAQTTLINFTVTRDGLEEQLLATVVKAERPDLEELKSNLTKQQNLFKITLKKCEDNLLYKLSSATGNILGDVELVENLETTKKTAKDILAKSNEAKLTSSKIDDAREQYRACAARAALLYFVLNDLSRINAMYQFSLKAFTVVFRNAIQKAGKSEKLNERVEKLIDNITFCVFMYTSRGLFERDKPTFLAHMTFQIFLASKTINAENLDFLLRFPTIPGLISPVEFLTNTSWGGIKSLSQLDELRNLDKDLEGSAKRWKKFVESPTPEKENYPGEWKNKNEVLQLCMMRALRPDRMTYAMKVFVEEKLGTKYITSRTEDFEKSYEETSSSTATFFILSAGVNPLKYVEVLGKKLGFTHRKGNFHSVSLGQGQEIVAESSLDLASDLGHWVILENIHLVTRWLPMLEKKMDQISERSHKDFRLFLSAEPSADPLASVIPQGILETCIKITNEPPTGMFANLHKALDNFNQATLEMCSKESEFKSFLFSLCYFHAVVAERRKFGPQGWNRNYPFNVGDLTISVNVLFNYLESNNKIPYDDLRYLFGEIMYGGHITDDWDRRLCRTYLEEFLRPELLEGYLEYAPGFPAPQNFDYEGYHKYIDRHLPPESPCLYGLHPNAEIGFLTQSSEDMFKIILELQPRDSGVTVGSGISQEDKVKEILEDILDKVPEPFPTQDMLSKLEDKSPFAIVALQECERMNILSAEMKRSLSELDLGLKGELTITSDMEQLQQSLFIDQVPDIWSVKAYPSLLSLGAWTADLYNRIKELENWVSDFLLPPAVWLGGFFNPQSFLTAIMQQTARRNEWPLDKMCLLTDVTKKQKEDFSIAPRDGAYIYGLYMEGARWEPATNSIAEAKLKDLVPTMPVVYIRAITQDKQDLRNMYDCPVYKTRMRGPTFVWTFYLKTKERAAKWTLAGVAILLQV